MGRKKYRGKDYLAAQDREQCTEQLRYDVNKYPDKKEIKLFWVNNLPEAVEVAFAGQHRIEEFSIEQHQNVISNIAEDSQFSTFS